MTVGEVIDKINQITSIRNALSSVEFCDQKIVCPENFRDNIMDLLDEYRDTLYNLLKRGDG